MDRIRQILARYWEIHPKPITTSTKPSSVEIMRVETPGYGLLEQPTATPVLQAYISQHQKVSLRGIDYAYYLMIHHYEDFQKAGITMAQTRDAYLAAYKESLDQRKGQPGKAQEDKTAYHLLGSLYQAQGDQAAAAAAFARAQDGTEQEATQAAA